MEFPKFCLLNFIPRHGVIESINVVLELLQSQVPLNSTCHASIIRKNGLFYFEIILKSKHETFECQTVIDPRESRCRERMWQVEVVREMAKEIKGQIRGWHERRFAA